MFMGRLVVKGPTELLGVCSTCWFTRLLGSFATYAPVTFQGTHWFYQYLQMRFVFTPFPWIRVRRHGYRRYDETVAGLDVLVLNAWCGPRFMKMAACPAWTKQLAKKEWPSRDCKLRIKWRGTKGTPITLKSSLYLTHDLRLIMESTNHGGGSTCLHWQTKTHCYCHGWWEGSASQWTVPWTLGEDLKTNIVSERW